MAIGKIAKEGSFEVESILPLTILLTIFYTVINIYIHFEYKSKRHIADFLFPGKE
jgi:hypothetical protein